MWKQKKNKDNIKWKKESKEERNSWRKVEETCECGRGGRENVEKKIMKKGKR